jgi:hypothetical protein
MALPMAHTFSRNISAAAVLGGKYANIRLKQITGNMNPQFKWITLHDAVATRLVAEHGKVNSTFLNTFSAACYYFGESLTGLSAHQPTTRWLSLTGAVLV